MAVSGNTIPLIWESTTDAGKGMDHYALYVDNVLVRNIQPNEIQPAANIAIGKAVTVSSTQNGQLAAANAVDGANDTRWASNATDNENFTVNLGSVQKVSRIEILWEAAYGKEYSIQFSFDGVNWKDVVTETNGKQGEMVYDNINQTTRYVRMQGKTRGSAYGYSMYEFRIFGTSSMQYNANGLALGEHSWYVTAYDRNNNTTNSTESPARFTVYQAGTNLPPYATAGEDQILILPTNRTLLDASSSYDPEGNPVTFTWTQKEGPSLADMDNRNAASTEVSGLTMGTYVFEVAVNDGVKTSRSEVTVIVRMKTAVEEFGEDGVSVFPNPVQDMLHVVGPSNLEISSISVINVAGKVFFNQRYNKAAQAEIDCSDYANGVYFVKINHRDGIVVRKVVKE